MKHTENYNLNKPDVTDNYSIAHSNNNMDVIDIALQENKEALITQASEFDSFKTVTMSQLAHTETEIVSLKNKKADKTDVVKLENTKASKLYVDDQLSSLDVKINAQTSGSPKGTYATLLELQTAFPVGNSNIYVVTADGKWYYWDGSDWTAGGIYQSEGLADKSVGLEKISDRAIQSIMNNRINNMITNSDFTDSIGWIGLNASISALNNTLISSGSGISATIGASFETNQVAVSNHKYFVKLKARVTNDACTLLRFRLLNSETGQTIGVIDVENPEENNWYDFSNIITVGTTHAQKLRYQVIHVYADITITSGKTAEIRHVNLIDLSETYGVGKEPDIEKMKVIINSYVNEHINGTVNKNDGEVNLLKLELETLANSLEDINKVLTNENETWVV